jgi:hypothetical protein
MGFHILQYFIIFYIEEINNFLEFYILFRVMSKKCT